MAYIRISLVVVVVVVAVVVAVVVVVVMVVVVMVVVVVVMVVVVVVVMVIVVVVVAVLIVMIVVIEVIVAIAVWSQQNTNYVVHYNKRVSGRVLKCVNLITAPGLVATNPVQPCDYQLQKSIAVQKSMLSVGEIILKN